MLMAEGVAWKTSLARCISFPLLRDVCNTWVVACHVHVSGMKCVQIVV